MVEECQGYGVAVRGGCVLGVSFCGHGVWITGLGEVRGKELEVMHVFMVPLVGIGVRDLYKSWESAHTCIAQSRLVVG